MLLLLLSCLLPHNSFNITSSVYALHSDQAIIEYTNILFRSIIDNSTDLQEEKQAYAKELNENWKIKHIYSVIKDDLFEFVQILLMSNGIEYTDEQNNRLIQLANNMRDNVYITWMECAIRNGDSQQACRIISELYRNIHKHIPQIIETAFAMNKKEYTEEQKNIILQRVKSLEPELKVRYSSPKNTKSIAHYKYSEENKDRIDLAPVRYFNRQINDLQNEVQELQKINTQLQQDQQELQYKYQEKQLHNQKALDNNNDSVSDQNRQRYFMTPELQHKYQEKQLHNQKALDNNNDSESSFDQSIQKNKEEEEKKSF